MLGLGKASQKWQWHISGKHPAARDFFVFGQQNPIDTALADWMRRGAEHLGAKSREFLVSSCSWRFWAKTPGDDILACGILRNSSDSLGRPFPLLILGTGSLDGWEKNWDLLPFACEGAWSQMEQLATKTYSSFDRLKEDVSEIRPPRANWPEMAHSYSQLTGYSLLLQHYGDRLVSPDGAQSLILPLQDGGNTDLIALISHLHRMLKEKRNTMPKSLFVGGLMQHPGIALFLRPLAVRDFENLWQPFAP